MTKLPYIVQVKCLFMDSPGTDRYLTSQEVDYAFAWALENCVVTGARPAVPVPWVRLKKEN